MEKFMMAMDQGTTSSRAILFDHKGAVRSIAQKEYTQYYPQPGWVEHDAMEIWSSQLSVAMEAMGKIGAHIGDIAGIGITNQRETTVVWDRHTGEPVCRAIVWQCRRTAGMIENLKREGLEEAVIERTGLIPDAYFSGSKIKWILDHVEGAKERARRGDLLFGTVDTWLIWNLTEGKVHVTDYTNASRTMLFDIRRLCWDRELLDYFQIPNSMLPEVKPSSCLYGYTSAGVMGGSVPIAGAAGDQQSSLFGQCCFEKGEVKNTYGTGCFLLMHTGGEAVQSTHGLLTTVAAGVGDKPGYALEGSVFVAGAGIQWLRDEMRMVRSAAQTEDYCRAVQDTAGVYVVPAFAGLGAPYWETKARGTVVGITRGTTKEHFIRAVVESMAYQVYDLLEAMERDSGVPVKLLKVDGGACVNDFLLQFQADLLDSVIARPECIETTAMGAAYLAGLSVGYWSSIQEIKSNCRLSREFKREIDTDHRKELLQGWKRAVRCAVFWANGET